MMMFSRHRRILLLIAIALLIVGIFIFRKGKEDGYVQVPKGWVTRTDEETQVTFSYPKYLDAEYITALDWPPQVQVFDETFTCLEAGNETQRAGKTEGREINGREYCITTLVEGAAGSIYTQYAYAFPRGEKVIILTFSTRAPQCGNYPEPEKLACESERAAFNIDDIIDRIAGTI